MRLALPGLPRVPAEPDAHLLAVVDSGIEQEFFDVAWIGPLAYHIEEPVAAAPVAAELNADRPIGVVELGLFGGREIPIADDVEIRRNRVDDGTPLPLEIEPGSWPDLPIVPQQALARQTERRLA